MNRTIEAVRMSLAADELVIILTGLDLYHETAEHNADRSREFARTQPANSELRRIYETNAELADTMGDQALQVARRIRAALDQF